MKISQFLRLLLLLGLFIPSTIYAENIDNIIYSFNDEDSTATVTGFAGSSASVENLVIPDSVMHNEKMFLVTAIEKLAFNGCSELTSLTIPKSISEIGDSAFNGCTGIKELILEDGLHTLSLGSNGNDLSVFSHCPIDSLYLGRNLYYGSSAPFRGFKTIRTVVIGDSVTVINEKAFAGCSGLISATFGDSVTVIETGAFMDCTSLTQITLSESLTKIGDEVFSGCSALTSLTIPDSVTEIGNNAFQNCLRLTYIYIPESVKSIGREVFENCSALTHITIPSYATSIGWKAFAGCSELTSVTIPESVTSIDSEAFWKCTGLTELIIPESVTSIGSNAFYGCTALTSIHLPNTLTYIGSEAFDGCPSLKEIHISSIEAWCNIFFRSFNSNPLYCVHNLYLQDELVTELVIPDAVTEIKNFAFYNWSGLTSVTIPESVTAIGDYAFEGCTGLTSVDIPNSVTKIGDFAFYGCTELTQITIPESVTEIGRKAFYGCSKITDITLPESITTIGDQAFYSCSALTSVTIPDSVTEIGQQAFYDCTALTSVTIPKSVTSIRNAAFAGCTGLTAITIPGSVTEIEGDVFAGCTALKELSFEDGSDTLNITSANLIADCPVQTLNLGRNIMYQKSPFQNIGTLKNLNIGDSVTDIGKNAFAGCKILVINSQAKDAPTLDNSFSDFTYQYCKISIPKDSRISYNDKWADFKHITPDNPLARTYTVNSPGDLANQVAEEEISDITEAKIIGRINGTDILTLNKLLNLTSIDLSEATIVEGGSPYYSTDSTSFETQNNVLDRYWAYNLDILTSVQFPANLTKIGNYSLYNCAHLVDLKIPGSVTTISSYAFAGCSSLAALTIPGSVNRINNLAFSQCTALKNLTIEDQSKTLSLGNNGGDFDKGSYYEYYKGLFSDCPIETLYLGRTLTYNSDSTPFDNLKTLKSVTIGNSVPYIGGAAFAGCSALESVTIGNSVTEIGSFAFDGCTALTAVELPDKITKIGNYSFWNCSGITSLNIPNSVTKIGRLAFYGCSALTSLTLPNSITEIGDSAFYGCSKLPSIEIPNSVTEIRNSTFTRCSALASVTIPNSITGIGNSAFAECSDLTEITIPGSVRKIGAKAFADIDLKVITLVNPIPPVIESNTFAGCTDKARLNVPEGSINIYRNNPCWSKFDNIYTTDADKNEQFIVNNIVYTITSEPLATVEVSTFNTKTKSNDALRIVIPEEVTFNNKTYAVAGIANNGFTGTDISAITLPKNICYVGLDAFKGCNNITSVTCLAQLPPTVHTSSFEQSVYGKATLSVSDSAETAYHNDEVWQLFFNNTPTGIENIESIEDNKVHIEGGDIIAPESSEVYDLNGRRVNHKGLRPGIYIVRIPGSKAIKVKVK